LRRGERAHQSVHLGLQLSRSLRVRQANGRKALFAQVKLDFARGAHDSIHMLHHRLPLDQRSARAALRWVTRAMAWRASSAANARGAAWAARSRKTPSRTGRLSTRRSTSPFFQRTPRTRPRSTGRTPWAAARAWKPDSDMET